MERPHITGCHFKIRRTLFIFLRWRREGETVSSWRVQRNPGGLTELNNNVQNTTEQWQLKRSSLGNKVQPLLWSQGPALKHRSFSLEFFFFLVVVFFSALFLLLTLGRCGRVLNSGQVQGRHVSSMAPLVGGYSMEGHEPLLQASTDRMFFSKQKFPVVR